MPKPLAPVARRNNHRLSEVQKNFAAALSAEDMRTAVEVLRDGMSAMKLEQQGRYTYETVPDHGTRLSAAKLFLEYALGKPVAVSELNINPREPNGFEDGHEDGARQRLALSGLDLRRIADAYSNAEEAEVGDG